MLGIDTIVLTFYPNQFAILQPGGFTPNVARIYATEPKDMGKGKYVPATRNPTKQETATFGYLPCLTFYKGIRAGGVTTGLRVQFSAPKLVNGNNFDELVENDLEKMYERIFEGLKFFGIRLFNGIDTVINAKVATIHYAKNFPLTNYMTARDAVSEVQKCDVTSWRDVSNSEYQSDEINNGHGFKTHSKYYELAFYDKIAEYYKGTRRQPVFDKDLQVQLDLFGGKKVTQPFEVLRMEARLNNPKTIKVALEKAGFEGLVPTLANLCTKEVSQAILKQQLAELYSKYPRISSSKAPDLHSLFSELYVQNPSTTMTTILSAIGLRALNEDYGTRKLKDIVGSRGSPALLRQSKKINELAYRFEKPEVFQLLDEQLDRFEPVQLDNFVQ